MFINFLIDVFRKNQEKDAIVWGDTIYTYGKLLSTVQKWVNSSEMQIIAPGSIVALEADFSPNAVALMLALIERACIIVPLTASIASKKETFYQIAQIESIIKIDQRDDVFFSKTCLNRVDRELLHTLKKSNHPGLILFSSGSTGENKAALHDFVPLLGKFKLPRHSKRILTFLLFDHIGGINTLLYTLSNAGCVVTVQERSPKAICAAIEKHQVEVLPTSPTFINLLLLSDAYKYYDLNSLQLVTYGTEVMHETTLERFRETFPKIRLLQTYGLSEVGILRSKSKSSDSLWLKIGGEGFETRIKNGMLEIKAKSAMLGYLNAPDPFTEDGWFMTGDAVEKDGDYIRILGRKSEIINIGGEKVYPVEVENVLQTMEGVEDVVVSGEAHPITRQMIVAQCQINTGETLSDFRKRMRIFCQDKLAKHKIPQKVILVDNAMHGERFKKMRPNDVHAGDNYVSKARDV